MEIPAAFRGPDGIWNSALVGTATAVILTNAIALMMGITVVFSHLLYIPVVIGAYRYPRHGLLFSAAIGLAYLILVILFRGENGPVFSEALIRACVLVIIGWLIATLSLRLRGQEDLYRGLFDNSEAGSILARKEEDEWIIEEVNWNASELLGRSPAELKGAPLTLFWNEEQARPVFARLSADEKIYAEEAIFTTRDGDHQHVLVSIAALPGGRAIITGVDITKRVNAEEALQTANEKLSLLSQISSDHLHRTVNDIIETADLASSECKDAGALGLIDQIRKKAWNLARQIFLTETYQGLGASPPGWIRVQDALRTTGPPPAGDAISVRSWAARLEVYADPLFRDVLAHLVDNSIRHGAGVHNIVVSYREIPGSLELIVEDDGKGIPQEKKESIFEYDSGQHAGLGLFICRQILAVTGITIAENGVEGRGARFVMRIADENFRIEGTSEDAPVFPLPARDRNAGDTDAGVRELLSAEFPVANEIWIDYHATKGDPRTDRIFAAFAGGDAVSLARCRWHPDGLEVDAVFTPAEHRGHGYAHLTVKGLVEACGNETLYMHSVLNLTDFYGKFGFVPIGEDDLPPTIKERFAFAGGQLEGANVQPMKREPPL